VFKLCILKEKNIEQADQRTYQTENFVPQDTVPYICITFRNQNFLAATEKMLCTFMDLLLIAATVIEFWHCWAYAVQA